MIAVTLYGTPGCRRYVRMRHMVLDVSNRLGIPIDLHEIGDVESLSRINPLSLPRLYIGDELVASQNPPAAHIIETALAKVSTH